MSFSRVSNVQQEKARFQTLSVEISDAINGRQMKSGQMKSGQMKSGQMKSGQMKSGQMKSGQMCTRIRG